MVSSYSVDESLTLHEPVVVTFTVENNFWEPVVLDLGRDRAEHFRLAVKRGAVGPRQQTPSVGGVAAPASVVLAPGERHVQSLILDDQLVFEQPGVVEVDIWLERPMRTQTGTTVAESAPTTLRFEIHPRNEATLRERCARLVALVTSTQDVGELHAAARELVSIRDPVAVACIGEALQATDRADFVLLQGLIDIGGQDAIAVLQDVAGGGPPERAILAKDALRRLGMSQ